MKLSKDARKMKIEHLETEHFTRLIEVIQQITPSELQNLAKKYFVMDDWIIIVVK